MKRLAYIIIATMLAISAKAQESQTVFNFLRLPVSAHVAALGGENITVQEDDASLVFHNPALANNVSDKTLNLNMMTYMEGSVTASASFLRAAGERGTWAVSGRFISYGEMKETDMTGQQTGTFSAKDMALGATYAYALSNYFSGGITAKFVGSYIGQYNSLGACIDVGLNYYHSDTEWSVSAVARNLGGQLTAYDDDFERMPLDLQLGVSKRLVGSPLRFSATLVRLNDWEYGIGRHLVLGADLLLGNQFYLAAGYNPLRAKEMKISSGDDGESSHGAALSLGGGVQLEKFKLHVAYARYHVSCSSLLLNISYAL
ncbi:MAG: type IX secretion system protein PorQ [Prevotella sp.]|nr:type IX secretion system protein PorQ [Prevotella sp.]MBR1485566.1 type IX secretion system protein PorQ [Prevotella sp.]